jgi:hypothetical protein
MAADAAAPYVSATVPTTSCCCPARGCMRRRVATLSLRAPRSPARTSRPCFTTELSPALIGRIGLDAEVAATHTLAVAFPLLAWSLQVRARARCRV